MNDIFRLLRIAKDLKIRELAEKMGISPSYISEVESGKKKPSLEMIEKYSTALDIPKSVIFYFVEQNVTKKYHYQELLLQILQKICSLN